MRRITLLYLNISELSKLPKLSKNNEKGAMPDSCGIVEFLPKPTKKVIKKPKKIPNLLKDRNHLQFDSLDTKINCFENISGTTFSLFFAAGISQNMTLNIQITYDLHFALTSQILN